MMIIMYVLFILPQTKFQLLFQTLQLHVYIYIVVLVTIQYFITLTAQNASSMQCGFTPKTYSSLQIKSPFFGVFQGTCLHKSTLKVLPHLWTSGIKQVHTAVFIT